MSRRIEKRKKPKKTWDWKKRSRRIKFTQQILQIQEKELHLLKLDKICLISGTVFSYGNIIMETTDILKISWHNSSVFGLFRCITSRMNWLNVDLTVMIQRMQTNILGITSASDFLSFIHQTSNRWQTGRITEESTLGFKWKIGGLYSKIHKGKAAVYVHH